MDTRNVSFRRATLDKLTARPFDLLVIGGGITGAGIARDAAMRGLRTALVDAADLGAGTSSRSSRLIHGGLRYLEQRQLPPGARGRSRTPDPAADRAPPGAPAAVRVPGPQGRPGAALEARGRHAAVRPARAAPECAPTPHPRQARPARGRADAARTGTGGRRPLLRRPVRRRPPGGGHRPLGGAARRGGGDLHPRHRAREERRAGARRRAWRTTSCGTGRCARRWWSTRPAPGPTTCAAWRTPAPAPCSVAHAAPT